MDNPSIGQLEQQVDAVIEEFDQAIAFHETWKATVYDQSLLERMGTSLSTNAFLVIRSALRRELLLALARPWDKRSDVVRMTDIDRQLQKKQTIDALVETRGTPHKFISDHIRGTILRDVTAFSELVKKWDQGSHSAVLKSLKTLRHEFLAHRAISPSSPGALAPDESHIEELYQDNLKMVRQLSSIVKGVAYNPSDTIGIFQRNAELFWRSVRGERTSACDKGTM